MEIITLNIENELDLVLAHKRAVQISEFSGISTSDQTKFATAISEICRNCLEYVGRGGLHFRIFKTPSSTYIEAKIEDKGKGIENLKEILRRNNLGKGGRGFGIVNAKKLVDFFEIESNENGTTVVLGKTIPSKHPPINTDIVAGWKKYFEEEVPVSPYEALKERNIKLITLSEELKVKNIVAQSQLDEIQRLNRKLKKVNEGLEDFAYAISHDLNTPLSNLKMIFQLLDKIDNQEEQKKYIEMIKGSVFRLESTIKGLIDLIDFKNNEDLPVNKLNFSEVTETVLKEYLPQIELVGGKLILDFDECPEIVYVEPYLKSILSNLISNAIKYRSEKRNLILHISSKQEDDYVLLSVMDNGRGLDLNRFKEKLFKPFTRFYKEVPGRGIGLHIIKKMIEKNDGKLEVVSQIDMGTEFKCYLKSEFLPQEVNSLVSVMNNLSE